MLEAASTTVAGRFGHGRVDPSEAGKKGVEERERRRRERLDETRQALEARAQAVAERLTDIALGKVKASPTEVTAANSVLDRVIAKAAQPLSVEKDASLEFMRVLERLERDDEGEKPSMAS